MTIRKKLVSYNIAMIAVPFVLMALLGALYRLSLGLSARGDLSRTREASVTRALPWRGMDGLDGAQILALSRTIAANPSFFKDETAMARLENDLGWIGSLAVVQNGNILYASPGTQVELAGAALENEPSLKRGPRMMIKPGYHLAYSWEFSVPGETPAAIRFLLDNRQILSSLFLPGLPYFILGLLLLVLAYGSLTYFVSRSFSRPLARLEAMALRIRDGDLSGPREAERDEAVSGEPDEFDAACRAFEEMRLRLKDSLERQADQEENRRELIAAISHDLRTPLSAVKGYAEGLRDGVADTDEKRSAYLATLLAKTRELDRLIEDLFLFSRLELKGFPYDMRKTELRSYLEDCIAELAPDYPSLSMCVAASREANWVTMDPLRMKRAITNVVQNAAAYAGRPDARLSIGMRRDGSDVIIRFADNGPGLRNGEFELVFERFRRLDPSRGRGGAGLGLSIARLIVEAHGGSMSAESAETGGACFVIRLPLGEA